MDDLIVWVALGIVLGGRIGYVLFYNLARLPRRTRWRSSPSGAAACRSTAASSATILAIVAVRPLAQA